MNDFPSFFAYAYMSACPVDPHHMMAYLQSKHVIGKDNNLVASRLVVVDQVLACLNLVGVHGMEENPLSRRVSEVLSVKFGGHGTPNLGTLVVSCDRVLHVQTTESLPGPWQYARSSPGPSSWPHTTWDRSDNQDLQFCRPLEPGWLICQLYL